MPTIADGGNFSLKEEIRSYWSGRAASFDAAFGHGIHSQREMSAWRALLRQGLGEHSLDVLDLACGTGEITRALLGLGHRVTGIDFAEPMVDLARKKHGAAARIYPSDAEHLLEPDASFDALVTRHLVWTLTDPEAAFVEWRRVLRPGGSLLIVDGDWVNRTFSQNVIMAFSARLQKLAKAENHTPDREVYASILSRLFFRDGLTARRLVEMLRAAGFATVEPLDYRPILRAQQVGARLHDALRLGAATRFVLLARKS